MKNLLLSLLLFSGALTLSARPYSSHSARESHPVIEAVERVPWQTVAAGGAATGTVVAAYKVSNGIEDGIKIAAEKHPEVLADCTDALMLPLLIAVLVVSGIVVLIVWLLVRKLFN